MWANSLETRVIYYSQRSRSDLESARWTTRHKYCSHHVCAGWLAACLPGWPTRYHIPDSGKVLY